MHQVGGSKSSTWHTAKTMLMACNRVINPISKHIIFHNLINQATAFYYEIFPLHFANGIETKKKPVPVIPTTTTWIHIKVLLSNMNLERIRKNN